MSRDRDQRSRRMEPMGFGGARVYVGDIGHRIGKFDLQREFEQYGQVLDVWMTPHNENRMQDKKFAFVVFRYAEDADIAVRDKNGREVCGRKVRVEHAKPPKPQMNRNQDYHRGGGYGYNRGRGDYNRGGYYNMSSRQPPPRFNRYRQRSLSPRERSYRRSPPSNGAPRNRRPSYEDGPYPERNRNNSFSDYSPDRRMKRPLSYSPEDRSRKQMKPSRQDSRSLSQSPPPKQARAASNSMDSRSPSPPPKKMKKKKQKKTKRRSPSQSPNSSPERGPEPPKQSQQPYYSSEEGDYDKPAKSHKSKKSKSSKKKKREMESGEDYSSGDSY